MELDYIPREVHRKLGRAERHNAAWRGIFRKVCDELGVAGAAEVDMVAGGVSHAKNSLIRRAGASPQQAVFGREVNLPETLLGNPDAIGAHMLMTEDQQIHRRAEIRSVACHKFYEYDLEQAMKRGEAAQARKYKGDFTPGDPVGVYYKYEGRHARARFVKGHVVVEGQPERDGQTVVDRVWVAVNGRMLNVSKDDLRDPTGSELRSPDDSDMAEIRKAEAALRSTQEAATPGGPMRGCGHDRPGGTGHRPGSFDGRGARSRDSRSAARSDPGAGRRGRTCRSSADVSDTGRRAGGADR